MFDSDVRLIWKDDLEVLSVSDRVAGLLGYERGDLLSSRSLQQLVHPRDLPLVHALFAPFAAKQRGDVCLRIRGADSRIRCLRFSHAREWPVRDRIVVRGRLSDGRDKAGLSEPSADLMAAMDSIGQAACCKDLDHFIVQANQAFQGLFPGEARELAGLTDYDLFPEDYADKSWAAEEQVLAGGEESPFVVQGSTEPRQKQSFENRTVPIRVLGKTTGFYSLVTDVAGYSLTERTWREEAAQEAYRLGPGEADEPLAGPGLCRPGRLQRDERTTRMVGDQLLNAITQRMSSVLHETDTLARLGGDEFAAVLLANDNIERSLMQIGRLGEVIGEPVQSDNLNLQTSASIGITFYPQADEVEPDQLLRQADQAMYFAKLAGKARYHVFDPMLDRSMRGRHEDLQRIRQALHAEEFELYFQPKVNMRTGAVRSRGADSLEAPGTWPALAAALPARDGMQSARGRARGVGHRTRADPHGKLARRRAGYTHQREYRCTAIAGAALCRSSQGDSCAPSAD